MFVYFWCLFFSFLFFSFLLFSHYYPFLFSFFFFALFVYLIANLLKKINNFRLSNRKYCVYSVFGICMLLLCWWSIHVPYRMQTFSLTQDSVIDDCLLQVNVIVQEITILVCLTASKRRNSIQHKSMSLSQLKSVNHRKYPLEIVIRRDQISLILVIRSYHELNILTSRYERMWIHSSSQDEDMNEKCSMS